MEVWMLVPLGIWLMCALDDWMTRRERRVR